MFICRAPLRWEGALKRALSPRILVCSPSLNVWLRTKYTFCFTAQQTLYVFSKLCNYRRLGVAMLQNKLCLVFYDVSGHLSMTSTQNIFAERRTPAQPRQRPQWRKDKLYFRLSLPNLKYFLLQNKFRILSSLST